jgi:CRP-like cAMP-binding protein
VSLFSQVASDNLARVAQLFEFREVNPEATLMTQDELGTSFFVLLAGSIGIYKDKLHVKTVDVSGELSKELLPVIGESALIKYNATRDATVMTESACQLLVCRSNHFKELLRLMPRLKQQLMEVHLAKKRQSEVMRDIKRSEQNEKKQQE